ncbi:hypothetical protein D3C75_878780 [compost metagenome]
MKHHCCIHFRIFENPVFKHHPGSVQGFFTRLKHKLNRPVKLPFVRLQDLRSSEQHRRMQIMTACMHVSVQRRKRKIRFFLNGQPIHIRTDKNHLPVMLSADGNY